MRETQILRGLHKARAANRFATGMVPEQQTMNPMAMPQIGLSRGTAYLNGPGTGKSDSIHGVSLSKGEAVLPAKTVAKVGVENIARLIEQTNDGIAPARGGLRAGGHFADARVPPMEDVAADLLGQKRAPSPPPGSTAFNGMADNLGARGAGAGPAPGLSPEAQTMRTEAAARAAKRTAPPMGGTVAGPTIDATQPAAAPKPAPKTLWQGVKGMFAGGEPTAPAVQAAPKTPAQRAQAWNPKIDINGDALKGTAKGAAEFAGKWGRRAGKLAAPLGVAMDAADVTDVATDSHMDGLDVANEVASKASKWGAAGAGAIAGGAAGALAGGGLLSPVTAPLGAIGGGLAGYFGADAAIKGARDLAGTETTDPSERSYGAVSKALGDADPYAASSATGTDAPLNPNQTAGTAERTGLKLASRQAVPMQQDPRLLNADTSRPELGQSRDFSNELNGARKQLPADLREGVVHKTVDAQGRVTYSGRNVGPQADGSTQMVDGLGRSLKMRGSVETAAPGSVAMGQGGYAFTPAATTAEGRAAQKQAWEARTAVPSQDPAAKLQAEYESIMNTPMDRKKRDVMMQGLQARMQQQTAAETNAISREHNQLTAQGNQARLGLDRAKIAYDMRKDAVKAENDDAMLSPFATEVNDKGERKVSEAAANDLRQFRRANAGRITGPDGKPIDMVHLRATNPTEHARMATAQDAAFGLGRLFNKYAKDKTFGAQTGWGAPNISGMREMSISDWTKGAGLTDAALARFKPGYYSQGVEIDLGGRKQIVPLGEILDDQNGGQLRETLNAWRAAHKLPPLGNAVTGE